VVGPVVLALAAAFALPGESTLASHPDPPPASLEPCTLEGPPAPVPARCGWVPVDESLGSPQTRTLELRVIVVPATGPTSGPPLFFVPGGPGEPATPSAFGLLGWMAPLRAGRDLVFVDPRGTGESSRLDCPPSGDPLAGAALWSVGEVRACVKALSRQADLTRYTTEELARDLDTVRRALGLPEIDLLAFSGGTRVAMELMRRHPEGVRQAILISVVPFDMGMPASFAPDMEAALDHLVDDCASDAACGSAYPLLRADLGAVFAQLRRGGVKVALPEVAPGSLTVRYGPAADAVRSRLYSISLSADLPRTLHRAAHGDFVPLATAIAERTRSVAYISTPVYLSSTCAEDLSWINLPAARRLARGTILGTTRLDAQSAACANWPRRKVAPDFRVPLATDIPVLAISGNLDPVTPPRWAEHAFIDMTQAWHLVVPIGSHSERSPCVVGILREFLERGTVDGVDTGCLADARRPPFVVD